MHFLSVLTHEKWYDGILHALDRDGPEEHYIGHKV
jgi:hypothetical protein